jgi:hypothetical protein
MVMKQLLLIILTIYGIAGFAQNTSTSIGLRGGGVSGLSIKIIDDDFSATEMILGFQMNGFRFTGLVQKYKPIAIHRIANFFFVSGIGGHAGYIKYNDSQRTIVDGVEYYSYREKIAPVIGADLMLGFEYRFESIPINISLDYKPYFELFGQQTFRMDFWDIGFTLRYNFN